MKNLLFHFHTSEAAPDKGQGYEIRVPAGISDKQRLLQMIATLLEFPEYFGFNWDALDECLADLAWLQKPQIWMWHEDVPLASNPSEARHYLQVLDGVLREPGSVSLQISFPESVRNEVQELLT